MSTTTTRRAAAALTLLTLALVSGCGADSSGPDTRDTASPSAPTVAPTTEPTAEPTADPASYDGADPAALVDCLVAAGQPAVVADSVPFGVEVPVAGVTVPDGVDLWVFADAAAAGDNRALITLADDDTPTSRVVANVVVRFYAPPAEGDALAAAVEGCLPA